MRYFEKLWSLFHKQNPSRTSSAPQASSDLRVVPVQKASFSLINSISDLVLKSPKRVEENSGEVFHFWHQNNLHIKILTERNAQGVQTDYGLVALRRGPKDYDPVFYFRRHHMLQGLVVGVVNIREWPWEKELAEAVRLSQVQRAGPLPKADLAPVSSAPFPS